MIMSITCSMETYCSISTAYFVNMSMKLSMDISIGYTTETDLGHKALIFFVNIAMELFMG